MRRERCLALVPVTLLLASAAPFAWSHHAFSARYDLTKDVTVTGAVTKVDWVNPHVSFYVETRQSGGKTEEWRVEAASPNILISRGLKKDSVKIGTAVTIAGYRAKDGALQADGELLTLADGRSWSLNGGFFIPLPPDSKGQTVVLDLKNLERPVLPPPIRVLSSNGVKAAVEELKAVAERAFGRPLEIEFSTTRALQQRIEAGEAFDVALLTKDSMEALVRQGKIGSAHTSLARTGIGVGFRKGAAKPDVRTPDAMKRTLLGAKSVAYTVDGASRPAIDRMLSSLGIAREMERKTLLEPAGQAPLRVAEGKAELVLTLISEILPISGIELAGPLPSAFQSEVVFEAGLGTNAKDPDAGKALVGFLAAPTSGAFFKRKGMEAGR